MFLCCTQLLAQRQHIKVLRDGAWPASSCGHTGVPFAPPTFLALRDQ